MKDITKIRDWLLENAVDENGDLVLNDLDFSEFAGDVYMHSMKVQGNLYQHNHEVQGDLYQSRHEVQGGLYQSEHVVQGDLAQYHHKTQGDLLQSGHEVQGNLYQSNNEVQGNLHNENNKYGGYLDENRSEKILKEVSVEESEGWRLKIGELYEEAQNLLRESRFLTEMKVDFKDNSDDVNWEDDDQRKYSLRFDHPENRVAVAWCYSGQHQGTLYTTNREWLEQYIEENKQEIKEYCFGIE